VADYWFACSAKAAEHLYGEGYRDYSQYFDIPNAINAEQYLYEEGISKRIRKDIGVGDDVFLCGHVGSFTAPKNHSYLLEIFQEVLKIKPQSKLICCGSGTLMPQVKEKAKELGIDDRILFPGVIKNCNEYMMAMDVLIFPSLFEGFPVTVIEAEATGLPVVVSDVITKEVDITDIVYRLSLTDSPQLWAKEVCRINPSDRKQYNNIVVESKYNMRTSAKMIMSLYEDMIKN
jgi:glycosyltransferase involved in cell wall biosynthesis